MVFGDLLAHYDQPVADVRADRQQMVRTHGEPDAANVMITPTGPRLVDLESALLAPPERDLWVLDLGDGSAHTDTTGHPLRAAHLEYYRLGYDLFGIAGYMAFFRATHTDTADAAASWQNLGEFLPPEARWPTLFE